MTFLGGCREDREDMPISVETKTNDPEKKTFLALGDSYTIGESVDLNERWPAQLVDSLNARDFNVARPHIIAVTGWTTNDLLNGINREKPQGPFDLVSLLIGVNNQYRGNSVESYRPDFQQLLQQAIALAGGDPRHVFVLSIPDWGVTPFAAYRDSQKIAQEIDAYNAANRDETLAAGAFYVDITGISRQAKTEPGLIAGDGLHPSGEMYREWVKVLLPVVEKILAKH